MVVGINAVMNMANMDGAKKSAILLLSLDRAMAAELLGKLPREQVESVTLAIASADKVTREEQESVLEEFKTAFASRPLMQPAGPDAARELLEQTLDRNDVDPMQQRIDAQVQAGPFAFLHRRHPDDIRLLIREEHPQTIALISAQLPSDLAAQVLAGFNAEIQTDILERLARIGPTDVEVLADIAALLHDRIGRTPVRTAGISRVANLLRETTSSTANSLLRNLNQKDGKLAESIRDSLFSFNDVASLDDSSLQFVLQKTDQYPWAIALKGCAETLRQRILALLSNLTAQALKREIDTLGPLRLSEIAAVQRQIAERILMLEAEGEIDLGTKRSAFHRSATSSRESSSSVQSSSNVAR